MSQRWLGWPCAGLLPLRFAYGFSPFAAGALVGVPISTETPFVFMLELSSREGVKSVALTAASTVAFVVLSVASLSLLQDINKKLKAVAASKVYFFIILVLKQQI